MRKAVVNFLIEGVTLAILMALIATGFIIEFRLPPGSSGEQGRGGGGAALTQLGLSRHDWGEIHFWLSMSFIVLLVIHLFLHWRWIWGIVRGRERSGLRSLLFWVLTLALLGMAALPWIIPVERTAESADSVRSGRGGEVMNEGG